MERFLCQKQKKNAKVLRDSEILGIYGQNGSGKTAVVDALYFLQQIMVGNSIEQDIINYINAESDTAEINAEFKIYGDEILYEVGIIFVYLGMMEKLL